MAPLIIWMDPQLFDADAPLRHTLQRLGHRVVDNPADAEVTFGRASVGPGPWVAVCPAGDEPAALAAFDAGAVDVLRWPAPDRMVERVLAAARSASLVRKAPAEPAELPAVTPQARLHMFSKVLETSEDGLALVDEQLRLIDWNPALGRYMGLTEAARGEPMSVRSEAGIDWPAVSAMLTSGQPFRQTIKLVNKADGALKYVDLQMFAVWANDDGKHLYAVMGRDVTELQTTADRLISANEELHDAQTQLVRSEKMASLGMMVAGIAHEINTPMGAIASMQNTLERAVDKLQTCLSEPASAPPPQKLFDILSDANRTIRTATARVTSLIKRLRAFARLDEAELKPCDLHEALDDTLLLMQHELKHGFTVEKNYGAIPAVACYAGRLNQVFLNLLMNAKQASTPPATIVIRTGTQPGWVWVAIADNGHGIAPEHLPRIFDPGFTTKGVGVGVGLGLAICYQIMQEHYGRIDVDSTVDLGTTFTAWIPTDLPQRQEAATEAPTLAPSGPFRG